MNVKVWSLKYIVGNTGREVSDASNPQRRAEILAAAQRLAGTGWRAWVEHHTTGRRIFESPAELEHRAGLAGAVALNTKPEVA